MKLLRLSTPAIKKGLKRMGFYLQSIPGPPGKREMTRAIKREIIE